ncbi:curli assembly chaperone CsgC [Pseudocitrobacter cyperus]|uniref:Curli assembly protein CsgC n=1 Tax=Pseudocitrobacter cyperus TaxID=3112843 RepID=A0ABV0HEZ6_9ENTR
MPGLIFAAMIVGTLSFDSKQEGDQITVSPILTLPVECQCEINMETERRGAAGVSRSRQKSILVIQARKPQRLATLILVPVPGDDITVTVRVSDGREVNLSEVWSLNPHKS